MPHSRPTPAARGTASASAPGALVMIMCQLRAREVRRDEWNDATCWRCWGSRLQPRFRMLPAVGARPPCAGFLSGGDEKGAESFVAAMLDGLLPRAIPSPKQ